MMHTLSNALARGAGAFARTLRGRPRTVLCVAAVLALAGAAAAWVDWLERPARAAERALGRYEFDEALAQLEVRAGRWPVRASLLFLAARTARRAGAYDRAEHYLAAYKASGAADSDRALLERVLLHCEQGDLAPEMQGRLVPYLQKIDPDSALIQEALGHGLMVQARYSEALACLRRCLEKDPANGRALFLQGVAYAEMRKPGDAVDSYRRLLDQYPGHWDGRVELAGALLAAGHTDEATARLEALYRERPDDAGVLLGLAVCRGEAGRPAEASDLLDRLLAAHPDHPQALVERGRLALDLEEPARAERWLQKAVDLAPASLQANQLLYVSLREQGKEAAAGRQQARVARLLDDRRRIDDILRCDLKSSPNDPDLQCELGRLYLRNGQEGQGLRWLQSALRLNPAHAAARQALAEREGRGSDPRAGEGPPGGPR
jgi:tetratricopeptide (TPR) repeat protein